MTRYTKISFHFTVISYLQIESLLKASRHLPGPSLLPHSIPSNSLRRIRLLQASNLLLCQLQLHSLHCFINPLRAPQPNNRIHALFAQAPSCCYRSHRYTFLLGNLFDAVHDSMIDLILLGANEEVQEIVGGFTGGGAGGPRTSEGAAGDG